MSARADRLRWGILGTGRIARTVATAIAASRSSSVHAAGSRDPETAARFAREFSVPRAFGDYDAVLADPDVEVVYIATPHPSHAALAIRAAAAKKHVLCEKPLGMNHAEVSAMVSAARDHDVFLMEAFMYRCHPQTAKVVSLVRDGAIGRVRAISASFGIAPDVPPTHRLLARELGGGGILDLGGYPASMARLIAGAAIERPFSEPLSLHALGHVGASSCVDEYSVAICDFPGDIVATLATGVTLELDNGVRIYGSEGRILVREPWHAGLSSGTSEICIERGTSEVVRVASELNAYTLEVEAVAAQLSAREASQMTLADSLGNALFLDRWRAAIGLEYPDL